jgi:uncharacterized protein (TIGR02246 family)
VSPDAREIERVVAAQVDGWNRGDARAWAQASEDDVGFTNILGMRWDTRTGFEVRHAEMFRGMFAGSQVSMSIERLRFPGPDFAVAELLTVLTGFRALPPGIAVATDGKLYTRMLEVFAKRDGRWRIVACHNTAVRPDASPLSRHSHAEAL